MTLTLTNLRNEGEKPMCNMKLLREFIGNRQLKTIADIILDGEEGDYYIEKLNEIQKTIEAMPGVYQSEDSYERKAFLHYFMGSCDWYIFEKDTVENEPQLQAFGFACINGDRENAELGYVCIEDVINHAHAEIDLHYEPETMREILTKFGKTWHIEEEKEVENA